MNLPPPERTEGDAMNSRSQANDRPKRASLSGSRRLLRLLAWCLALGAAALIVWCATLFFIILRYDGQPAGGALKHADVGIVLGASLWRDKPSPGLRERLDHALELYRAGDFDRFLVSGGLDNNGATLTEAEGMRNYLLAQGVPADAVVMETKSHSTCENLKFSQAIMQHNGWTTAIIVTHQYHGSRAGDIAASLGYSPVQVSVTDSQAMNMAYHRTREVLAYTKWLGQKWLLHGG
ncbi:YdcF family protein [Cohnella thermotolerans]|uniref:YdcF family protein n=1 Tax=Cohnella thermotolerans TaxID=329858 RepID=UPI0004033EA0|nr:YdcF family protein [Cohnella thermotolerans]